MPGSSHAGRMWCTISTEFPISDRNRIRSRSRCVMQTLKQVDENPNIAARGYTSDRLLHFWPHSEYHPRSGKKRHTHSEHAITGFLRRRGLTAQTRFHIEKTSMASSAPTPRCSPQFRMRTSLGSSSRKRRQMRDINWAKTTLYRQWAAGLRRIQTCGWSALPAAEHSPPR